MLKTSELLKDEEMSNIIQGNLGFYHPQVATPSLVQISAM